MTVWPISVWPRETMPRIAWLPRSGVCAAQCVPVAASGDSSAASLALAPLELILAALRREKRRVRLASPVNDAAAYGPPPDAAVGGQVVVYAVTWPGLGLVGLPFSQASKNDRPCTSKAATSLGWLAPGLWPRSATCSATGADLLCARMWS